MTSGTRSRRRTFAATWSAAKVKMGKRIEYVDIAKAIAIFTVVLGHVNQATTPGREWL